MPPRSSNGKSKKKANPKHPSDHHRQPRSEAETATNVALGHTYDTLFITARNTFLLKHNESSSRAGKRGALTKKEEGRTKLYLLEQTREEGAII